MAFKVAFGFQVAFKVAFGYSFELRQFQYKTMDCSFSIAWIVGLDQTPLCAILSRNQVLAALPHPLVIVVLQAYEK